MVKDRRVGEWVDALASKAPVPGGGGASALGGALGAALGQMVVHLTIGKKRYADVEEEMEKNLTELNRLGEEFLRLADRDGEVFAPLAEAYSMPSETREQREEKERVMEERLLAASLVPLEMMEKALLVINILEFLGEKGSRMAISDVGVAAQFAKAALTGAAMNVYINTKAMKNREKAEELNRKAEWLIEDGKQRGDAVYEKVLEQLRHQCINGSC
ncbi:sugar ABC transporter substrate-binding protein [Clostridiaceae bacterium]|nr:cyclodeaminase/cyclohydrolase family protein [Lachnospiraceae bacterium]NBH17907.1 sugar ABC transporter substrate-binding protein [Clostridiaceae bacterium]